MAIQRGGIQVIVIHAFITIDAAKREKFLELSKLIIKNSQAEEGNISYQLYEEADQPNSFVMLEEWKDLAAIQFHGETDHFKNFMDETSEMLVEPLRAERYEIARKL
ncbi:antibiotic biosynthesis monooxygenase [Bacillus sp. V33-4]|nr:antibiotic biosynthesis monooxygenase [Bacillus sp. V33-4]